MAGSLELRVPLSSVLSIGRLGVNAFVDTGAVYAHDERFGDQSLRTGIGGGVWLTATVFHMGLAVGRGRGSSTRVHFSAGVCVLRSRDSVRSRRRSAPPAVEIVTRKKVRGSRCNFFYDCAS